MTSNMTTNITSADFVQSWMPTFETEMNAKHEHYWEVMYPNQTDVVICRLCGCQMIHTHTWKRVFGTNETRCGLCGTRQRIPWKDLMNGSISIPSVLSIAAASVPESSNIVDYQIDTIHKKWGNDLPIGVETLMAYKKAHPTSTYSLKTMLQSALVTSSNTRSKQSKTQSNTQSKTSNVKNVVSSIVVAPLSPLVLPVRSNKIRWMESMVTMANVIQNQHTNQHTNQRINQVKLQSFIIVARWCTRLLKCPVGIRSHTQWLNCKNKPKPNTLPTSIREALGNTYDPEMLWKHFTRFKCNATMFMPREAVDFAAECVRRHPMRRNEERHEQHHERVICFPYNPNKEMIRPVLLTDFQQTYMQEQYNQKKGKQKEKEKQTDICHHMKKLCNITCNTACDIACSSNYNNVELKKT